jgi:hypothetical protein
MRLMCIFTYTCTITTACHPSNPHGIYDTTYPACILDTISLFLFFGCGALVVLGSGEEFRRLPRFRRQEEYGGTR